MRLFSFHCIVPPSLYSWLSSFCSITTTLGSETTRRRGILILPLLFRLFHTDVSGLRYAQCSRGFLSHRTRSWFFILYVQAVPTVTCALLLWSNACLTRSSWVACSLLWTHTTTGIVLLPLPPVPPLDAVLQLLLLQMWSHAMCISQFLIAAAFLRCNCCLFTSKVPRAQTQPADARKKQIK